LATCAASHVGVREDSSGRIALRLHKGTTDSLGIDRGEVGREERGGVGSQFLESDVALRYIDVSTTQPHLLSASFTHTSLLSLSCCGML
jgi:hypothetical protein